MAEQRTEAQEQAVEARIQEEMGPRTEPVSTRGGAVLWDGIQSPPRAGAHHL